MKVKQLSISEESLIYKASVVYDYSDSYAIKVNSNQSLKPEKYAQSFLTSIPNSVIVLMKIRNILVAPFKISNDDAHVRQAKFDFNKGDKIVFFYVLDKSPSELLLYANDHHLEAWLSFITHQDEYYTEVIATTVVKFNNKTGTIYFFLIKPFHKIIMKSVLKRMAKNISNNKLI